jgi:hypothetical protein
MKALLLRQPADSLVLCIPVWREYAVLSASSSTDGKQRKEPICERAWVGD